MTEGAPGAPRRRIVGSAPAGTPTSPPLSPASAEVSSPRSAVGRPQDAIPTPPWIRDPARPAAVPGPSIEVEALAARITKNEQAVQAAIMSLSAELGAIQAAFSPSHESALRQAADARDRRRAAAEAAYQAQTTRVEAELAQNWRRRTP